jgi:ribonuclease HI
MENQVGAGLFVSNNTKQPVYEKSERLPNESTVFQAELHAIILAANYLISCFPHCPQTATILTDSQSALQALNSTIIRNPMVKRTHLALERATHLGTLIDIQWIKAHTGAFGNTEADELAKQGARLEDITDSTIPIPLSLIKQKIDNCFRDTWAEQWTNYPKARQTKFFFKIPDKHKAKQIYYCSRDEVNTITRCITGHNAFSYHLSHVDPEAHEPFCRFCDDHSYETFIHFITDCPRFAVQRHQLNIQDPSNGAWDTQTILQLANIPPIQQALLGIFNGEHYTEI